MIAYIAHPVGGDVEKNIARAKRWLRYLARKYTDRVFLAPYVTELDAGVADDAIPSERAAALERMCVVARRCDEIWIVGCGGEPTAGMQQEIRAADDCGVKIVTTYDKAVEPPKEKRA